MFWILVLNILFTSTTSVNYQTDKNDLPEVNKKVIEYVESVIGTKVDRGECWDLAAKSLDFANANWDGMYEFGDEYDIRKTDILPGDILQFKNVIAEYTEDNAIFTEQLMHHTAIVYKVHDNNLLEIAHQNTGLKKNIVVITNFNPDWIKKGSITYFRPLE